MIKFNHVNKIYPNGTTALRDISLEIPDGEFCLIVGRSGSGKTTLLKLLTRELEPTSGEIIVNDLPLHSMPRRRVPNYRRRLGVVFQDFRLLQDRTVYENIAFAQLIAGKSNAEIRENVAAVLKRTGLSSKYNSYPNELSGGEQQRVAIARALVNKPEVLLADEPTGNLDHENAKEVIRLLLEIEQQGTTVILITHDRELVNTLGKRVVTLAYGELVSDVPASGASPEPVAELDLPVAKPVAPRKLRSRAARAPHEASVIPIRRGGDRNET